MKREKDLYTCALLLLVCVQLVDTVSLRNIVSNLPDHSDSLCSLLSVWYFATTVLWTVYVRKLEKERHNTLTSMEENLQNVTLGAVGS